MGRGEGGLKPSGREGFTCVWSGSDVCPPVRTESVIDRDQLKDNSN